MLSDVLKQEIQFAYSQLLKNKSLRPRLGQKQMIADIARTLSDITLDGEGKRTNKAGVCAIEAGTGTGKTVAYTMAVLPLAKALKKKVVISTATVALQEQILKRDLPDIQAHSGLQLTFSLAKGRGRYLCLSKLDLQMNCDAGQQPLFIADNPEDTASAHQATIDQMAKGLLTGEWDGDKDNWPEELDDALWSQLTADRNQCSGRRCQHVAQCSFIKARDHLNKVDCIVANHDLVMADLALGGGAILPPPEQTLYIFDEAHHLSDIAIRHFSGQVRVNGSLYWFDQTIKDLARIQQEFVSFYALMPKLQAIPPLLLELKQLFSELKPLIESVVEPLLTDMNNLDRSNLPHFRFPHGEIPNQLESLAAALLKRFEDLIVLFLDAHALLNESLESNDSGLSLPVLESLFTDIGQMLNIAEKQQALWFAYGRKFEQLPDSRWIQLLDIASTLDYELCASPLLAANTLSEHLWQPCCGAVLTSATLSSLGDFSRLAMQTGMPDYTHTAIVQSPFNYQENARFVVPSLQHEPIKSDAHTEEIATLLPILCKGHLGVLVLFSSRRQLQDVFEQLDAQWQSKTLRQNHLSKQALLDQHIRHVKSNTQSIVFGLASLAEGVDLPGNYCTHVIIAKLPFSVPNDPVDSALAEWMEKQGRNPFMEIALPDAARRLIQACGRLIRNEKDQGQITLLDKRIITKRYGRLLLDALPPFKQILDEKL